MGNSESLFEGSISNFGCVFFSPPPFYSPRFLLSSDLPSCLALFDLETIFTPKRAVRPFVYDPLDSWVERPIHQKSTNFFGVFISIENSLRIVWKSFSLSLYLENLNHKRPKTTDNVNICRKFDDSMSRLTRRRKIFHYVQKFSKIAN